MRSFLFAGLLGSHGLSSLASGGTVRKLIVCRVKSDAATLQLVELQGTVDPLPKVVVLDRHHLAEVFPPPTVFTPFKQSGTDACQNVAARRNQCHARGLAQSFQTANQSQQFQTVAVDVGLDIFSRKAIGTVSSSQHKPPSSGL